MPKPVVAITRCSTYEAGAVEQALKKALSLLPGLEDAPPPGNRILLKVDLENTRHRDPTLIAHPAVIKAAANAFSEGGSHVSIGDAGTGASWALWRRIRQIWQRNLEGKLPGKTYSELLGTYEKLLNVNTFQELNEVEVPGAEQPLIRTADLGLESDVDIYRRCGMLEAAAETAADLSYFEIEEFIDCPSRTAAFLDQVPVARAVHQADRVVSIPKLRMHGGCVVGAIVNMFRIVPTTVREVYTITATISGMGSHMLVDVFSALEPLPLAITDAVTAIDPDHRAVDTGLIVAGNDCVAHDAVLAVIAGLDPMEDKVIRAAHEAGLGQGLLENIEIRGVSIDEARASPLV